NRAITPGDAPELALNLEPLFGAIQTIRRTPSHVAPHQTLTLDVAGTSVGFEGTLLLFDLRTVSDHMWFFEPRAEATPVLYWGHPTDGDLYKRAFIAVGDQVYLAYGPGTLICTFVFLILAVIAIAWLARKWFTTPLSTDTPRLSRWLILLCSKRCHLSLSRTQVAFWTVAIGGAVVAYGIVRSQVPNIPQTMLWLIGMSLSTGALRYWTLEARSPPLAHLGSEAEVTPKLEHLVLEIDEHGHSHPSLPKAQMLFWTVAILLLFITKTIVEGELWAVPP